MELIAILIPIIAILSVFVIPPAIVMFGIFAIGYFIVKATASNNSGATIDSLQRQILRCQLADLKRELREIKQKQ